MVGLLHPWPWASSEKASVIIPLLPKVWDCGDVRFQWLESLAREGMGRRESRILAPSCPYSNLLCMTPQLCGLENPTYAASLVCRDQFFFGGTKWWWNSLPSLLLLSAHLPLDLVYQNPLSCPYPHTSWRWPWEFWFCSFQAWDERLECAHDSHLWVSSVLWSGSTDPDFSYPNKAIFTLF